MFFFTIRADTPPLPPSPEIFDGIFAAGNLNRETVVNPIGNGQLFAMLQSSRIINTQNGCGIDGLVLDLGQIYSWLSGSEDVGNESGPRIRFVAACLENGLGVKPPTPHRIRKVLRGMVKRVVALKPRALDRRT